MGFAWHKLIPRRANYSVNCPPPCTDTGTYTETLDSFCAPPDPDTGTQLCNTFNQESEVGGAQCGGKPVLVGGVRSNPLAPLELRINMPLECYRTNNSAAQGTLGSLGGGGGVCEMGSIPALQLYYYRTPNSPSSTPLTITGGNICVQFNPFQVPDRMMVISGRNRYRYGGWGVDPSCDGSIPALWDNSSPGATGIKQAELSLAGSLGRVWPLPNSVLDLPLFGANTSSNPGTPPAPCSDGACSDQVCFSVRSNTGIGHFGPTNIANGKGYYSFQCFNPQTFYQGVGIPTCSVWALLHAIWWDVWQFSGNEASFRNDYPTLTTAFNNIFSSDPSGTNTDISNVRYRLQAFASQLLADLGISFIIPNVFFWDKAAYDAAGSNTDKWKHLYVVGNANVIFDTQCLIGQGVPGDPNRYGFVIHLDEVSHDPTYGSTGNARMLGFFGCDSGQALVSNNTSQAYFELATMNCVPIATAPAGDPDYCAECPNVQIKPQPYNFECKYQGYFPDCPHTV